MLKKSLFIGTFVLLFIGLSDYGYGCHKGGNDSKGCGGGSDTVTVKFTEGAFIFDDQNNEEVSVNMILNNGGATSGRDQDFFMSEQADSWEPVFADCTELPLGIPDRISVDGGDLTLITEPDTIYLSLHDIRLPIGGGRFAKVTVQLRGDSVCDIVGGGQSFFPPATGVTIECTLDQSLITGRGKVGGKSEGCRPPGSGTPDDSDLIWLGSPSILSITAP